MYKRKRISNYRVQRLESLGFEWTPKQSDWMNMYNRLLSYKRQHNGSTAVPRHWKEDPQLGFWVKVQRYKCKEEHRINLLNNIGFNWQGVNHSRWMEMYDRLVVYKKKYGNTHVPYRWEKDRQLGVWVTEQRCRCKEEHRIHLLNDIGFLWKGVNQKCWMEMYERLVAYKKKHGTTYVLQRWGEDPQLGYWVSKQRHFCRKQDRIDLLNKIGFVWKAR